MLPVKHFGEVVARWTGQSDVFEGPAHSVRVARLLDVQDGDGETAAWHDWTVPNLKLAVQQLKRINTP